MSKRYALKAEKRERAGKGIARSLRRENKVPGVIYGDQKPPVLITLPEKELRLAYQKGGFMIHVCEMDVEGTQVLALARDVQTHPVTDKIESVDFLRVGPKTKISVDVPVHFLNEDKCPGIKNKGVLNVVRHSIELRCLVTEIPEFVEIDLIEADLGDALKIADVKLPKGAEAVVSGRDDTIATIGAPTEYTELEIVKPVSDAEVAAAAGKDGKAPAKAPAKAADKKK
jgi:large subunit ribosomal protein L25